MSAKYSRWIAECCKLLGIPAINGLDMINDVSWFSAYDDGLTPELAVEEYKKHLELEEDADNGLES